MTTSYSSDKISRGVLSKPMESTDLIEPSMNFAVGKMTFPSLTGGEMSNAASTETHASHIDASARWMPAEVHICS